MKIQFSSLPPVVCRLIENLSLRINILSMICIICLCGCTEFHREEFEPVVGTKLYALVSNSLEKNKEWKILATTKEIESLICFTSRSGYIEIWFKFTDQSYRPLIKTISDNAYTTFCISVNGRVVCTFEWDISATIGYPGLCIRLRDKKEARRILKMIRKN